MAIRDLKIFSKTFIYNLTQISISYTSSFFVLMQKATHKLVMERKHNQNIYLYKLQCVISYKPSFLVFSHYLFWPFLSFSGKNPCTGWFQFEGLILLPSNILIVFEAFLEKNLKIFQWEVQIMSSGDLSRYNAEKVTYL